MVQRNGTPASDSRAPSFSVQLVVKRDCTICVDFGDIAMDAGNLLLECFLKTDDEPLIQIFRSRVALTSQAAVSQIRIPFSTSAPGTLFILCHAPGQDMIQLWQKIEP